jgi:transposase
MHVAKIERQHNGRTYVSYLLRRSYRQGGRVRHQTLANLSHLPAPTLDLVRRSLQGEAFFAGQDHLRILASKPHGHAEAVLTTCRRLGLEDLLASKPCPERALVLALIVQRIRTPGSKLAATRHWKDTTLAEELGAAEADHKQAYAALDWLLRRQRRIENKLARQYLGEGAVVLYDVSSSSYEGRTCPLAQHGYNRDGKKGLPSIVYGLLTDRHGRPIALDVYPGNTADPSTVPDQVHKLRGRFGLTRVILVGDRGLLTQARIGALRAYPGLGWISALRSDDIREPLAQGALARSRFDAVDLAEVASPDFPGERLVACYNPLLAERRRQKRQRLLQATEEGLRKLETEVQRRTRTPLTAAAIGVKAGRIVGQYKMGKHFQLHIADNSFRWCRDEAAIAREEQLDGIYVIRTSEPLSTFPATDCVRTYKRLTLVEQAFRCLKGLDLRVRPIHHRVEPRVRAHLFLCLLASYVEWHMRRALKPLLYADEELEEARGQRDPVKPAEPSPSAQAKKKTHQTSSGEAAHNFASLLAHLGTRTRNTVQITSGAEPTTFQLLADPDPLQAEALRRLIL